MKMETFTVKETQVYGLLCFLVGFGIGLLIVYLIVAIEGLLK